MRLWLRLSWLGLLFGLLVLPVQAKPPGKTDVRLLVDISGSMKQNDPQNLRRPATRMLVGLMQPGTRAAVWTFARWTNPLVPLAEVDDAWKKRALAVSNQITSPGQFTHIELVLDNATKDWQGEPSTHARHLVLLTDGMVDVSKAPGESEASRERIITDILPRLQERGVQIHTIALSERADHDLMKKLSGETGGWYQQVNSADELQRVFLRVFEQVGKPDSVPLKDNKFTVDASVKEASVLLFPKEGSPPTVLLAPDGTEFTDTDLPAGVAWYRDQGYELITISSPGKGEWSLRADLDPDNRVMIVTDLKLETSEIPAHLAVGEKIPVTANLTNKGKVVTRKAFLQVLDVRADALSQAGSDPQALNDRGEDGDEKAGDGRYSMIYGEQRPFDHVELLFSVESPTFMREKRFRVAVHEPLDFELQGKGGDARALLSGNDAVLQSGATITLWQESADGERKPLALEGGSAGLLLADAPAYARVEGQSRLGNRIERDYGPLYPEGIKPPPPAPEPEVASEPEPMPVAPEPVVDEAPAETPEPVEQEAVAEEDDWIMPAIIFGVSNLVLILLGGGVWWFLRKKRASEDDDLADEFADDFDAEADISGEEPAADDQKGEAA